MNQYWQVKAAIIEVLGWFTVDPQFAEQYLQTYNAATSLSDVNVAITDLALAMMAQPLNEQIGAVLPHWVYMGSEDTANCGATTVGEFITWICDWGYVEINQGEPT